MKRGPRPSQRILLSVETESPTRVAASCTRRIALDVLAVVTEEVCVSGFTARFVAGGRCCCCKAERGDRVPGCISTRPGMAANISSCPAKTVADLRLDFRFITRPQSRYGLNWISLLTSTRTGAPARTFNVGRTDNSRSTMRAPVRAAS